MFHYQNSKVILLIAKYKKTFAILFVLTITKTITLSKAILITLKKFNKLIIILRNFILKSKKIIKIKNFFNFINKINIIYLTYIIKSNLIIKKTNVNISKIVKLLLKNYKIIIK